MSKSKSKTLFSCQKCGAQRPKWEGRCSDCGAWNTYVEEVIGDSKNPQRGWSITDNTEGQSPVSVTLDQTVKEVSLKRWSTGINELNRVLGDGVVPGSFLLLGGDPGIGKSTLLLQMAGGLGNQSHRVLYVSGEESVQQTALRAQRLGQNSPNVEICAENQVEKIETLAKNKKPQVLIVDSIQTVFLSDVQSAPGSVSQVRESAGRLMMLAKKRGITVILIGHVTKDGNIAGPRVLEHMVDAVLQFEGDSSHQYRLLRALKNRFGPANELGVFTMTSLGLEEVTNPSELFLDEPSSSPKGSTVFASMEGTRPILCEIQALTCYTPMAMPRRTPIGFDGQRTHLLVAVLSKQLGLDLSQRDVYINVVGGLKVHESAADLAVAVALLSSEKEWVIERNCIFMGEVGLSGEVRAVSFPDIRIREGAKLGFDKFYVPTANKRQCKSLEAELLNKIVWVKNLADVFDRLKPQSKSRPANGPLPRVDA